MTQDEIDKLNSLAPGLQQAMDAISSMLTWISSVQAPPIHSIDAPGIGLVITDSQANQFSFGSSFNGYGYQILKNGVPYLNGYAVHIGINLGYGNCWQRNGLGQWYSDSGTSWDYQAVAPTPGT